MNNVIYILMKNDGANPDSYPAFELGYFTDPILAHKMAHQYSTLTEDFYVTSVPAAK